MRGVAFRLLREALRDELSEECWHRLLEADGWRGYGAGGDASVPSDALTCWLGRQAAGRMGDRFPSLFSRHSTLAVFLESLGADFRESWLMEDREGIPMPGMSVARGPDGSLLLGLHNCGRLCALFQGFVLGAAEFYGEPVDVGELKCQNRGDNACVLLVRSRPEWDRVGRYDGARRAARGGGRG